jgi:predicted nucleotidyltransferase
MEVEILLGVLLAVSLFCNFFLFRLAMWQSRDLANVSDNLGDLVEILNNYREHLKRVYSLDSFYGDETLQFLMEHTNAVRALLEEQYGSTTSITDPIEYEIEEEIEDAEKEESEKEKHVLYAGTRRRDS